MLALTFAVLAQTARLPDVPSFDYTGVPYFSGGDESSVLVRSHSAIVSVSAKDVQVSTTTQIKNQADHAVSLKLIVPRRREGDENSGPPTFAITATLNQAGVALRPLSSRTVGRKLGARHFYYESDLGASITLQAGATYGLRTSCTVALGHGGADGKLKLTGYGLESNSTIGQFNLTYKTAPGAVFRLPSAHPDLGWQIGHAGAFVQKTNYVPGHQLSWITFYSGGFE